MTEPCVVVVAPTFPALSETFVLREVRGLLAAGHDVQVLALRPPTVQSADADDLLPRVRYIYGPDARATIAGAVRELLLHPWKSLQTLALSIADACLLQEPLPFVARLRVPLQAFAALGAAHRIHKCDPRHLHCHFAHASTTVGMYVARQLGISFSFVGHANDLFQRRTLLKRKLARAAFVSCISQWHRDFYSRIRPPRGEEYRIVRCGVEVPLEVTPAASSNAFRVLTVCRLVPKKGVDTLLDAMVELRSRHPNVRVMLKIIGDGPQRDALESQARRNGLADCASFLGALSNDQVIAALSESDVFALPCRTDQAGDRDGIPVVLMEAMAHGVPVIAGDLPAIRELVDGTTGILVPPEDPASLGEALHRLMIEPCLRRRLARAGRARIIEEFSLKQNLDRLDEAIRDVIGKGT